MERKAIDSLRYRACSDLDELRKQKNLSPTDYDMIYKLVGIVKRLDEIEPDEGGSSRRGSSRRGNWRAQMEGDYGNSYDGGSSGRRGRSSRDGGSSMDGSRDGYARHGSKVHEQLRQMLHEADEDEKEVLRFCMKELENL